MGTRLRLRCAQMAIYWRVLLYSLSRQLSTTSLPAALHRASASDAAVVLGALAGAKRPSHWQPERPRDPPNCARALLAGGGDTGGCGLTASLWDGVLWAVPKKRTSHSKKRKRMTHKYLKPKENVTLCQKCGNAKLLHVLCGHCLKETLRATTMIRNQQKLDLEEGRDREKERMA